MCTVFFIFRSRNSCSFAPYDVVYVMCVYHMCIIVEGTFVHININTH